MSAGQFCGECEICGEWEPLEFFSPLFCTHNPVYPFSIENPIIWYQSNRVLGLMATKNVTPGIITIAKYYFSENKTIDPGLILEPRVNW